MREIKITESCLKCKNLIYLQSSLGDITTQMGAIVDLTNLRNRCEYKALIPEEFVDLFVMEAKDKIADVIAVNYKYCFFKKNLKIAGLSNIDKEFLLTALIAADIEEDKKYIIKKLKEFEEYAIDGMFNFRMKPLKEKWKEIAGYIPSGFTESQLKDFVKYLIKDKNGKRVYVDNGKVYDKRFNRLERTKLLLTDSGELSLVKEILLSSAGEVELCTEITKKEENFLKEFYGEKIIFNEKYYE